MNKICLNQTSKLKEAWPIKTVTALLELQTWLSWAPLMFRMTKIWTHSLTFLKLASTYLSDNHLHTIVLFNVSYTITTELWSAWVSNSPSPQSASLVHVTLFCCLFARFSCLSAFFCFLAAFFSALSFFFSFLSSFLSFFPSFLFWRCSLRSLRCSLRS